MKVRKGPNRKVPDSKDVSFIFLHLILRWNVIQEWSIWTDFTAELPQTYHIVTTILYLTKQNMIATALHSDRSI